MGTSLALILHDTYRTFVSTRERKADRNPAENSSRPSGKTGRPYFYTYCGILMHSSLVTTVDGLPLGLAAIKFHGANVLKRKINPTRVPIEQKESLRWLENVRQSTALLGHAGRCVHIGDRESDIYEWFCLARELGTHFLVRTCVDRLAGNGDNTIASEMNRAEIPGLQASGFTLRSRQRGTSNAYESSGSRC
jgi:hypothetical protein